MPRPRIEDIRTIHPRQRTPPHRIKAHINIQHGCHRLTGYRRLGWRLLGWRMSFENGADDEEEDAHAHGGDKEGHLTAEGFDEEENEEGRSDYFDDAVDSGGEEGDGGACVSDLVFSVRIGTVFGRKGLTDWKI